MIETLKTLFNRDLKKLKNEIESYTNEKILWKVEKGIGNSAGNLCLHLIGNLNAYIGAEIGKTNYVRNRPIEFTLKDISKAELIDNIEKIKRVIAAALENLTDEQLEDEYPILVL